MFGFRRSAWTNVCPWAGDAWTFCVLLCVLVFVLTSDSREDACHLRRGACQARRGACLAGWLECWAAGWLVGWLAGIGGACQARRGAPHAGRGAHQAGGSACCARKVLTMLEC